MSGIIAVSGRDIVIENGVLVMLTAIDAYAQKIRDNLRFEFSEWPLEDDWGTPWHDLLVGEETTSPEPFENLVTSIILADDETIEVKEMTTNFDTSTRKLSIEAKIQSVYGPVDFADSVVLQTGGI